MGFSLDYYHRKKDQFLNQLNRLYVILQDMGLKEEMKKIKSSTEQIGKESFQIVVVGEFSRGKSTFINALLGKKILPSSPRPTTTLLNRLIYRNQPIIQLHYRNGKKAEIIDETDFHHLVAPKEPIPGDRESEHHYQKLVERIQTISYAEIGHPLSFCKDGVEIIDTPGTNDLDPAREQITNSIIPHSDAAIFILSAVKTLSQSEVSFLRNRILASDIQKVFVVINFKDELENESKAKQVHDFAKTKLKDILSDPKIFLVSSKQALNRRRVENGEELKPVRGKIPVVWDLEDTGFIELETALANFLQYDRGAVKLQKPVKRAEKVIEEILEKKIAVQLYALNHEVAGLKEKVEAFLPKLNQVKAIGKDALKRITMELENQEQVLSGWYEEELLRHSRVAMDTFDQFSYLGANEIRRKVEDAIAPVERDLHMKKKEKVTNAIKGSIKRISKAVNQEWFELEANFKTLLRTNEQEDSLLPALWVGTEEKSQQQPGIFDEIMDGLDSAWEKNTSFWGGVVIGVGFVATAVIGGIAALLSYFTGENEKTKLKRQLQSQLSDSKKQKLHSFQQEWDRLVGAVHHQYREIINQNVERMESQLKELLQSTKLEGKEIEKKRIQLERRAAALKNIRNELQMLYAELNQANREKAEMIR